MAAILVAELAAAQFLAEGQRITSVVSAITKSLVDANNKVRRIENTFLTFSGTIPKAHSNMSRLREVTDRLGVSFEAAASPFAKFASAADELSEDQAFSVFEGFATALSATHASAEKVNGTFLALQQIVSKGKVNMQDLRRQLAEHIPGAMKTAIKAYGDGTASMEEFEEAVRNGKVETTDWLLEFSRLMEEKFGPAAKKAAVTLQAEMDRMSTAYLMFRSRIMETSGANKDFIEILQAVNSDILDNVTITDNLAASLGHLSEAAALVTTNFTPFAEKFSLYASLGAGAVEHTVRMLAALSNLSPSTLAQAVAQGKLNDHLEDTIDLMLGAEKGLSQAEINKEALAAIKAFEKGLEDQEKALDDAAKARIKINRNALAEIAKHEKDHAAVMKTLEAAKNEAITQNKKEMVQEHYDMLKDMYDKTGALSDEFFRLEEERLRKSVEHWNDVAEQERYVNEELEKLVKNSREGKEEIERLAEQEERAAKAAKELAKEQERVKKAAKEAADEAERLAKAEEKAAAEAKKLAEEKRKAYDAARTKTMGSAPQLTEAETAYLKGMTGSTNNDQYFNTGRGGTAPGIGSDDPSGSDQLSLRMKAKEAALQQIYAARAANNGQPVTNITNIFNQQFSRSDVANITDQQVTNAARA